MAPEDSDGLGNYEVPSRTVDAGETHFERIRRILVYAGTRSASSSNGDVERLGTVLTAAGRRSARLTSSSATGGGTANDGAETQAITLHNLQEERMVVERLRAALPPPVRLSDIDFPETGGSALPGAEREVDYNEPLVQFAITTETVDDDSGASGGTTQGAVEGAPTLEVLGLAAGNEGAASHTELNLPALCPNSDRCHQVANLAGGLEHCCERCFRTNAVEHSGDCRWWRNTSMEPWPSLENTLNDITPAQMDF